MIKNEKETNKELIWRNFSWYTLPKITTIAIILAVIVMGWWFVYKISNSTLYSVEYEAALKIGATDITYVSLEKPKNPPCDYPGCSQESQKKVETSHLYSHVFGDGISILMKIPNEAKLQMCSDSFTYTQKNEHTVYDTNTYLVPQGDGKIKVETKTDKYIVHTNGGKKTVNYICFEGLYCGEHADVACKTWRSEVKDAFITNNAGYYFITYGFWGSILLAPVLIGISAGCFWLYMSFSFKRRTEKEIKSKTK